MELLMIEILHHPIYIKMDCITRIPMLLVYELFIFLPSTEGPRNQKDFPTAQAFVRTVRGLRPPSATGLERRSRPAANF